MPDGIRISIFEKPAADGPLAKTGHLGPDGKPVMDNDACWMSKGAVAVHAFDTMAEGARLIGGLTVQQAMGLGVPKRFVSAGITRFGIVRKRNLDAAIEAGASNTIARSKEHFTFSSGPSLMLLDVDGKWLTPEASAKVSGQEMYWRTITGIVPALAGAARIERASSSSFLSANGKPFPSSGNWHIYVAVLDGTDIPRATRVLHQRAMLAGLGCMVLGKVGQMLDRSIVDIAVASEERLVFEGGPVLEPPLTQDTTRRSPVAHEGQLIDTRQAIPDLAKHERDQLKRLIDAQKAALKPEAEKRQDTADRKEAKQRSDKTGRPFEEVLRQVRLRHAGMLAPEIELDFDDPAIGKVTVLEVLAKPDAFIEETLADPLEGIAYGRGKAKLMRGQDELIIHSFAHGRTIYRLVHSEATLRELIDRTDADIVVSVLAQALDPDALPLDAYERLVQKAADKAKVGIRIARKIVAEALEKRKQRQRQAEYEAATAGDSRVRMAVPARDAPTLETAREIDAILATATPPTPRERPTRGMDGRLVVVVSRTPDEQYFHELENEDDDDGGDAEREKKPAPDVLTLEGLDDDGIAMIVEKFIRIEKIDSSSGRAIEVALPVQHRAPLNKLASTAGSRMPVVRGVATVPAVSVHPKTGACELSAPDGYDDKSGIFFAIPPDLRAAMPTPGQCGKAEVAAAVEFLCDDWLGDVLTDRKGKAVIIAAALTLLQRHRLREKPGYFIEAPMASVGKTTVVNMISTAATGTSAIAAAWSSDPEERRKALFAFFLSGASLLCYDNVKRGLDISCPHIEKALTSATVLDRVLGGSVTRTASTAGVIFLNGNAVTPKGDLATRILTVSLSSTGASPADRPVKRGDPVGWTKTNQAKVLAALLTILMGARPRVKMKDRKTRFKRWWWEVGLAVETAFGGAVDFAEMFRESIGADSEGTSIAEFLLELMKAFGKGDFLAADVAWMMDRKPHGRRDGTLFTDFAGSTTGGGPDAYSAHVARADAMRECLRVVRDDKGWGRTELGSNEIGYVLRTILKRPVNMPKYGEVRLMNRNTRGNTRAWHIKQARPLVDTPSEAAARNRVLGRMLDGDSEAVMSAAIVVGCCHIDFATGADMLSISEKLCTGNEDREAAE